MRISAGTRCREVYQTAAQTTTTAIATVLMMRKVARDMARPVVDGGASVPELFAALVSVFRSSYRPFRQHNAIQFHHPTDRGPCNQSGERRAA